tara:strand:+ start:2732 stop:2920 length:189 start_codon:yes stop_codon:yes gene_type:complete
LVKLISTLEKERKMKIRKIKVVTIHGQTFTPKQLKEHHKELAKLDRFDIEEYEKNLPNLSII